MKLTSLTTRDRRALTIGLCIAVPSLVVPFVIKPYLHALNTIHQQTDDERTQLAHERQAITELPTLPAVRARAEDRLRVEVKRLFQSDDELVATGALAQYIAAVAQSSGLHLEQSETRPAHPVVPGVQALQVEIQAEGDLDGILHFLHQLESGGKLVRIGALSISAGHAVATGPVPATADTAHAGQNPGGNTRGEPSGPPSSGGRRFSRRRMFGMGRGGQFGNGGTGGGASTEGGGNSAGSVVLGGGGVSLPMDSNFFSMLRRAIQQSIPNPQVVAEEEHQGVDPDRLRGVEVLSLAVSVYGYRLSGAAGVTTDTSQTGAPSIFPHSAYAFESIDAIVDHDPFNATRSRPSMSYQEYLAALAQNQHTQSEHQHARGAVQLHLIGTVMGGQEEFAMCQNGDDPPQAVHVGDTIAGYTLNRLFPNVATFTTPDGNQITLQSLPPGAADNQPSPHINPFFFGRHRFPPHLNQLGSSQ